MFVDLDGMRFFALRMGRGARTFVAHSGWIGNVEDWLATLAVMSHDWDILVYDHRGTGETVAPVERITRDALVDDVFRMLDHFAIERCVLGGFSAGASTALQALLREPQRFDGLVLLNGTGGIRLPSSGPVDPPVLPSQWPGADFGERMRWFIEACTPEPDIEHIRRWGTHILTRAEPAAADQLMRVMSHEAPDLADRLGDIQVPTLLLHGELDAFADMAKMHYLKEHIPNCKLVVFENTGHLPAMTRPHDVADAINAFFGVVTDANNQQ